MASRPPATRRERRPIRLPRPSSSRRPPAAPRRRMGEVAEREAARPADVRSRRDRSRGACSRSGSRSSARNWPNAASRSGRTSGCPTSGSRRTACPASRSRSTWRIRGWRGSSGNRCSRSRAARRRGACASSATKSATRSTTPTCCAAAGDGRRCSARRAMPYPEFYTPKPVQPQLRAPHRQLVRAEPSRTRTSPRRSPSGSIRRSDWRRRYQDWPALKKLEYVDELMREIADRAAAGRHAHARSIRCAASGGRCGSTTSERRSTTASTIPTSTTATCAGCFRRRAGGRPHASPASRFINRDPAGGAPDRRRVDRRVPVHDRPGARGDGRALRRAAAAARRRRGRRTRSDFIVVLTVQTMNYLHSGRHRVAL